MAAITVQTISITGLTDPTFTAATAAGDTFINEGVKTFYVIKNGGGGGTVVTFDDINSNSPPGAKAFDADVDVSVAAAAEAWCGPFPTSRFGTNVSVTMTVDTSVTVAAIKL